MISAVQIYSPSKLPSKSKPKNENGDCKQRVRVSKTNVQIYSVKKITLRGDTGTKNEPLREQEVAINGIYNDANNDINIEISKEPKREANTSNEIV